MNKTFFSQFFAELVKERHSVRHYEINQRIPAEDLYDILEMAHTAPSAWNLQHWRVIVVQEQAQKEVLIPIANQQKQVADASVVFIILGDLEANKTIDAVYRPLVDAGLMPEAAYEKILGDVNLVYKSSQAKIRDDAFLNASLFAMQLMLAAKSKGFDTSPIGGFQVDPLMEALHIPERFVPVMMIAAGVARKPAHPTKRLPLDEVVIHESFKRIGNV